MSSFQKYSNAKRRAASASQSEVPTFTAVNATDARVAGYQRFGLSKDGAVNVEQTAYKKKAMLIDSLLQRAHTKYQCEGLLDVGCYTGMFGFIALQRGYTSVTGIEHDQDAVQVLQQAARFANRDFTVQCASAKQALAQPGNERKQEQEKEERDEEEEEEDQKQYDVVLALALVHWLYSCTEDYGSLRSIVAAFRPTVKRVLFIEWVDPQDAAMRHFKHTSFNSDVHREAYTHQDFLGALNEHFDAVLTIGTTTAPTRTLYAAFCSIDDAIEWKRTNESIAPLQHTLTHARLHQHSTVTSDRSTRAVKQVDDTHRFNRGHDVFAREVYWLTRLENKGSFPRLLRFNAQEKRLETEYCGEPLRREGGSGNVAKRPSDWRDQLKRVCDAMNRWDCRHNDMKPHDWLVHPQTRHLYVCDFGFASLGQDLTVGGRFGQATPPRGLLGKTFPDNWAMVESSLRRWPLP